MVGNFHKAKSMIVDTQEQRDVQLSVGIDFTFNNIKNVKKVTWKSDAPWYREVTDGFCWLAYCENNELSQAEA